MNKKRRVIVIILLAAIIGMAAWLLWGQHQIDARQLSDDIDGNGLPEKYLLQNRGLQVYEKNSLIWRTPQGWQVQQMLTADIDNNQQKELLLVVWKKGSFGKSKPFWMDDADEQMSCHLFVYRLAAGKVHARWCSSALAHPIITMDVKDSNTDGLYELLVSEGPSYGFAYKIRQYFKRQDTVWVWNGWGFERIE